MGLTNPAEQLNCLIPPLLYFNFKSFNHPNSASFIRFQSIRHDSGLFFPGFSNFHQMKRGDLISWAGNQFSRTAELIGPLFCISILKVLKTQILRHSLGFNAFCMIQEYLSHTFEICTN